MSDHKHNDDCGDSCAKEKHVCHCCGPTEFDFPEELLTPELKKMKESMSAEEFEKFVMANM